MRVVGFVLKTLLTYFEMLIVQRARHGLDDCCFFYVFYLIVWHTGLVSTHGPLPPPAAPCPTQKICWTFVSFLYYLVTNKVTITSNETRFTVKLI